MINRIKKHNTIYRYIIIGTIGTIFNICVYMMLVHFFSEYYLICNVFAYIVTLMLLYTLNKIYVFKDPKTGFKYIISQFFIFALSRVISLGIDTLVLFICIEKLHLGDLLSKIIANAGTTVLNYFVGKKLFINKF